MENVIFESSIPDNKSPPSDSRDDISCPVIADTPKDTTEVAVEELQEEPKEETVKASFEPDTEELRHGYRILKELMVDGNKTVNWPFMEAVDSEAMGLYDYYERVQKPMWLKKMKEKFESSEYETITQFVADFRLMLENCYRYNGPDHWVSKRGQRFETMLEQKLALLSRELREKTSIAATSKGGDGAMPLSCGSSIRRRGKNISPHDSSALLSQLRREEALKEREARKQQILERKAAQEAVAQELIGWENALLEEPIKTQLQHLWELPKIGLFLFLCQEPLNIGEVMQFELERSFAMARESVTLQSVMTTLLSTPYQRTRLDKKPMMPYSVWEEKLRGKIALWYKILAENDGDAFVAATKLGIDPYLFTVIGKKNPLDKKKFHELSYYRKIWIVKSLCDFCLATQESIREAMEAQPVEENREYVLGYDAEGNTYMHFPQFCGADLRVYRQAPIPHPEMDPIPEPASEPELESEPETPAPKANKRKQNRSRFNTKKKKRKKVKEKPVISPSPTPRPSRLRQHIKPVLPLGQIESSSSESETDDETAVSSMDESSTCSSTFTASSAYFRDRRFRNGSFSSKDNTPEPPSFRGKIRKPRNFDSRLNCYSPVSRLALEDGSLSSKEGTPEPVGSCEKDAGSRIKSTRAKSKMNTNNSVTAGAEDVDNANESGEETDAFKFTPFQNYADKNSGKSNSVVNSELKEKLSDVGSSKCDKQDEKSGYNKMVENKLEVPMNNVNSAESINPETESVSIEIGIVKENCSDVLHNENVNCDRMSESVSSDISASKSEKPEVKSESVKEEPNKYSSDSFTEDVKYEKDGLEGCQRNKTMNHSDQLHDKVLCEKMDVDCDDTCVTKAEMNYDDQEKCLTKAETKDNCSLSLLANMAVADLNDDLSLQEGNVKNQATDDSSDLVIKSEQIPLSDTCFDNSVKTESSATEVACRSSNKCDETETKCGMKPEICLGEGGETEDCSKQRPVMESLKADPVAGIAEKPEEMRSDSVQLSSEDAPGGDPLKEEPEEEEEDEVVPELGEFSLIADSVESLRNLVEKFAEPEPTPTRSKRGKTLKPPARKKCVVELHGHLMFLLKELEPWEGKLVQASKRARVKLRKEKESFKAEEEKKVVEDVWESEESASEEEESSSDSDADKNSAVKPLIKNGLKNSKAETLGESAGSSVQTAAVDNEETTTSSRGRIRKRRIIPNNTEDVPKKRKVVKNLEENFGSSGHCPNILQRTYVKTDGSGNRNVPTSLMQQLNMPALNTLNVQPNSQSAPNQTASQILLRANLSGNQSISSLLASSWAVKTPSGAKVLPAETVQRLLAPKTGTTHPVIQQLLAQKVQSETSASGKQSAVTLQVKAPVQKPVMPQTEDTGKTTVSSPTCSPAQPGLHSNAHIVLAGNKSRKIEIAKARPAAIQLSSVTAKGIPSTSKVQLYNQNVLSTLPPAVIQQLLKNQTLKIQTATSDKQGNAPIPGAIILSPSGNEGLRTFSVTGTGANPGQSHPKITGLVNTAIPAVSSVNSCVTSTQPSGSTTFSSNSLVPVYSGSQDSSPAITVPTSPSKPKYACHVTVKSLLQDRAKKALELQSEDSDDNSKDCAIVPSAAQVLNLASEVGQQLPGVLEMSKADSNSQPIVVTVNTAIKGLPQTLKLPSKETLDSAVQAVVTSVKTTLPTAHLKVPAPSTMPSIHPRKNVTRTIQSMKSPIPVINASVNSLRHPASTSSSTFPASSTFAIAQQSNSGGLNVKPSSQVPLTTLTASTGTGNQLTLNPQMDVTVSGKVVGGASVDTSPQILNKTVSLQANSNTLTMTPQMIMTAQGLIQGYLTPQGLVIPQSAVQQGSFSSKQVVLGQSINSQVQKKAIVSGSQGKVTPTTVSSMPGKVIKPTMLLPTSYVPKGPDPFKNAPVKSTIKSPVNSSEPLATASSSKLLLQAVNTAKSPNNLLQETVANPVINTGLSGTGPLPGSLMSGMNIRIDSKDSAGVEEILREHLGQLTNKLVSSENCHVDQKGDGGTQTSQPETTLRTKAPKHSVVEPVREQQPQHFVKKEPVCSKQQPTQLSDNSGLPAAQVLLSLSQGIQTSTSVVSPHKLKSVNEDPQPGKPQLISPSKTKQTPIASTLNQVGSPQKLVLLNIGGKLYTSQGIPVTLENGVLKIAESTSLKTTQPSLKQPAAHSSMLQIPAAVQGNVSVQKSGVHRSVKPVAPANQQSHPTVGYGVTAPQISSVPKPTAGLPQTALVPGLNNTSLPQSLSANMINHGQVMIRPVLPGTPALIQSQPQTMGSQNSVLAVPSQTQHPIQLVGLNSQQQHVIGGKGQVLQMVLPQASPSATQMNSAQLKSLVVAGQPGVIVAAPPRPAQIPAGQHLLSPKRISPKVPVSGVQFVQNVANPASGGQQQVLLQVISPNRAPTGTLSTVMSPGKNTPHPLQVNPVGALQNVVGQQSGPLTVTQLARSDIVSQLVPAHSAALLTQALRGPPPIPVNVTQTKPSQQP